MSRLEEMLALHVEETRSLREQLARFVQRQAAVLEGEVFEELVAGGAGVASGAVSTVPAAAGQTVTDVFPAQTSSVEVITGILVVTQVLAGPVVPTSVLLTLGERVIPVQNTFTLACPVLFKVKDQTRKLTTVYPAGAWTLGAYVALWGYVAPATNPPGRTH